MTLNFSARISIDAKEKTKSIFHSISTDNKFYPENPTNTKISHDRIIEVKITSEHLPHLRANLNSTLRLIQASYDSIESAED